MGLVIIFIGLFFVDFNGDEIFFGFCLIFCGILVIFLVEIVDMDGVLN